MSTYKDQLAKNLALIEEKMEKAASVRGRKRDDIRLMAVSKTRSFEEIMTARELGITLFGENRVQEAESKFPVPMPAGMELHMIGHLQSNKIKKVLPLVSAIQSVDSLKLAREISKRAVSLEMEVDIFLELNTSGEVSKSGFPDYSTLEAACLEMQSLPALRLRGLMTIGPLGGNEAAIRRAFAELREAKEKLNGALDSPFLTELSMGMSGDFTIAIEEGATLVRIGTTLFGARD